MNSNHVIPPADSIVAMLAIARLDDATTHHLRRCLRCRIAWYRVGAFRAGCTDPRKGVLVMGTIEGESLTNTARDHLERCVACRLLSLDAARAMNSSGDGV